MGRRAPERGLASGQAPSRTGASGDCWCHWGSPRSRVTVCPRVGTAGQTHQAFRASSTCACHLPLTRAERAPRVPSHLCPCVLERRPRPAFPEGGVCVLDPPLKSDGFGCGCPTCSEDTNTHCGHGTLEPPRPHTLQTRDIAIWPPRGRVCVSRDTQAPNPGGQADSPALCLSDSHFVVSKKSLKPHRTGDLREQLVAPSSLFFCTQTRELPSGLRTFLECEWR